MYLPAMFSSTIIYSGVDLWNMDSVFAQLSGDNNDIIHLTSTSTYTDDFGNFHVIGEVNNTSFDPQTNILITTILSDTTNNVIVGNHSAFSSIGTLRSGELSPFDILIPDPQIVGKFNFIEFSTSSQPATIEKPANLVLNGTNAFFDNVGNPHITGNIINQGQSPEQFINIVATFYDNSSLGIVGTQSFGLNVANLTQNQMAPFDITITDNKTKSQAAFYSLNVDSVQNSMGFPFNPKFSFAPIDGFIDSGLLLNSPLNNDLGFTNNDFSNNNNNNDGSSSGSGNGNSGSPSEKELEVDIQVAENPISPGFEQTYQVIVSDEDTGDEIAGAIVDGRVKYASGSFDNDGRFSDKITDNDGKVEHSWKIGKHSDKGEFEVMVDADADGYSSGTASTTFEVVFNEDNETDSNPVNNTELNNDTST